MLIDTERHYSLTRSEVAKRCSFPVKDSKDRCMVWSIRYREYNNSVVWNNWKSGDYNCCRRRLSWTSYYISSTSVDLPCILDYKCGDKLVIKNIEGNVLCSYMEMLEESKNLHCLNVIKEPSATQTALFQPKDFKYINIKVCAREKQKLLRLLMA